MHNLPLDVDTFIPHKTPIKMVDKLLSYDDDTKTSIYEYTIPESSPFIGEESQIDSECFLEIIAQAAAAQHGFNLTREKKETERGLLVGVREFNIYNSACVNDKLTITIECGTEIASLSIVEGNIKIGESLIASATITVWHGK